MLSFRCMESCCGAIDILGFVGEKPRHVLAELANHYFLPDQYGNFYCEETGAPLYFFADDVQEGFGEELCKYIRKHRIGQVTRTMPKLNPNSGNKIRGYVLAVHKKSLLKWANEVAKMGLKIKKITQGYDW